MSHTADIPAPPAGAGSGQLRTRAFRVLAWASWDWGSAAFNAVMTTFVFTVYLTGDAFGGKELRWQASVRTPAAGAGSSSESTVPQWRC
jgi:MFS-type transporter involved in bile tolerance (Atg22 family)